MKFEFVALSPHHVHLGDDAVAPEDDILYHLPTALCTNEYLMTELTAAGTGGSAGGSGAAAGGAGVLSGEIKTAAGPTRKLVRKQSVFTVRNNFPVNSIRLPLCDSCVR